MNYSSLQWIAGLALGRMLFCLVEGTLLAVFVAVAVRLLPGKSSQTRFMIWLSALLATAALPLLLYTGWWKNAAGGAATESVKVPLGVATYVFLGWAALALAGLIRVAAGLFGIRRLRMNSRELEMELLAPELRSEIEEFRKDRRLTLLVSSRLYVPTAIGFFSPAIVLPQWLVEEGAEPDLKHVVLHELAHLQRWDDWTNLLQKVIKALLFFHPAVWWMEHKISLDREMACDDAVLARTGSPWVYAELLARMAEKSFVRRQVELAQAVIGRLRQLSARVARILDPKRPASNSVWKPAVPAVMALAIISGAGLSWVPELVQVGSPESEKVMATHVASVREDSRPAPGVGEWPAKVDASDVQAPVLYHPAKLLQPAANQSKQKVVIATAKARARRPSPAVNPEYIAAEQIPQATPQNGFVVLVTMQETFVATPAGWRLSVTETRWLVRAKAAHPQPLNKT
jgi:beta-lactamase regulating signal transducer with metallopeptidase domain